MRRLTVVTLAILGAAVLGENARGLPMLADGETEGASPSPRAATASRSRATGAQLVRRVSGGGGWPGAGWRGSEAVVHAVLFHSPTCAHCVYVMEEVLPPLEQAYGERLQLLKVDVTQDEGWSLFQAAISAFAVPPERQGVPMLVLGNNVLVGSGEIPAQLPSLLESYLRAGGVDWPAIPGLAEVLPTTATAAPESDLPVVHIVVFWSTDCAACRKVVGETLPPLRQKYPGQLEVQLVDVVTTGDVDALYQVAARFGIGKDEVNLPLLIIGDHVLIGSEQIPEELPGLVDRYLAEGGVAPVDLQELLTASPPSETAAVEETAATPSGFGAALAVMVGMIGALAYSGWALRPDASGWPGVAEGRAVRLSRAVPWLAPVGMGVAAYLAYVEAQAVPAVCGPIGDCNAVQTSEYARLFGLMPIGVLGVSAYAGILGLWAWFRDDGLARRVPLLLLILTTIGVLFSLYLTYLERFVIQAVCAWCLASAVVMTLLMIAAVGPARQALWSRGR